MNDPLPGIEGAYEYRLTAMLITARVAPVEPVDYFPQQIRRIPVYMDIFGFVARSAEIHLTAFSIPKPVPRTVEDRLLLLLYDRTRRHHL